VTALEPVSWLITGATGQLGTDLQTVLAGHDVTALGRAELDLTDEAQVRAVAAAALSGSHQGRLSRYHCTVRASPSSKLIRGA
jgi:nucleoside-diphosphate-sugar epimerase